MNSESPPASWRALLKGRQGLYCLCLTAGIVLYAIMFPISYTVLPAIVRELGAEAYYSWVATVFALGAFIGACLLSHSLRLCRPHIAYIGALLGFALCTLACAYAGSLPFLLTARFIQGLSGGLLVALTYAMLNSALPAELLPRGIGLLSGMWGIATLAGPYIGGRFENWRIPFFAVSGLTLLFCLFVLFVFGKNKQESQSAAHSSAPAPLLPIAILTVLVLVISLGSVPEAVRQCLSAAAALFSHSFSAAVSPLAANSGALLIGALLVALLAGVEKRSRNRLLPQGAFSPNSVFCLIYMIILLNMIALGSTKLYMPLFLQKLHNAGQISAGYIAFTDSIGWSVGALIGAAFNTGGGKGESRLGAFAVYFVAPFLCILGMAGMIALMPVQSDSAAVLLLIGISFFATGFFSGIMWPHILARVMQSAKAEEKEAADSSIVTVQLFAGALADCAAGAVVNATGLKSDDLGSISHAALILFGFCLILLVVVFALCLKVKRLKPAEEKPTLAEPAQAEAA